MIRLNRDHGTDSRDQLPKRVIVPLHSTAYTDAGARFLDAWAIVVIVHQHCSGVILSVEESLDCFLCFTHLAVPHRVAEEFLETDAHV